MNQIQEHNSLDSFGSTLDHWTLLINSCFRGIVGCDTTNSVTWAKTLCDIYWPNCLIGLLTIGTTIEPTGILPYVRIRANSSFTLIRKLHFITTPYAGRISFLVKNDLLTHCETLLRAIPSEIRDWDSLQLTIIDKSSAHEAIYKYARSTLLVRALTTSKSPYILLNNTWNETFNTLPKKLRWTIRKGEKELTNLGSLSYCEYTKAEEMDELFKIIYTIEKQSWKEKSGSSITTQDKQRKFYEALARYATRDGTLSAHVLLLNNKPLAYILGLLSGDGSFLDLKESFVDSYSKYSPAHVLKNYALPNLINKGVRIYDFMGECEPYKMRWTDKTYERHTIVIYNKTLRGRLAYFKSLLSRNSTPIPPPSELNPALKETGL